VTKEQQQGSDGRDARAAATNELADRFFAAFIAQDADALEQLYDPSFRMRSPMGERTGAEHLALIRSGAVKVQDLRYEEVTRDIFEGGLVQQHRLRGVSPTGTAFDHPYCLVFRVVDGRITSLNEYYDPSPLLHDPMVREIYESTPKHSGLG
jgi:ketosteroid isomerase-like protein